MHPELFELKALVAGRLDLHRRREIDDHLGSCADCSRHYVAMMLGSSSPKTAEQEARAGHVAAAAPSLSMVGAGSGASLASAYGIDAPLAAPAPKPAPRVPNKSHSLDLDLTAASAPRQPAPVSPSLVDAITRLRAESDAEQAPQAAAAAPAPAPVAAAPVAAVAAPAPAPFVAPAPIVAAVQIAPEILAAPEPTSLLLEPSIFMPTPLGGVSIINPDGSTATIHAQSDRSLYAATPKADIDVPVTPPTPELVVTFSSTPARFRAQRSPAANREVAEAPVAAVRAAAPAVPLSPAEIEYVSQAVPTSASLPLSEFAPAAPAQVHPPARRANVAMLAGGAAIVAGVLFGGYRYFQSSVTEAAAAAAAAAATQVAAAAAKNAPAAPATVAPAPVQMRVVYVDRPSKKKESEKAKETPAPEAAAVLQPPPTTVVTLPDVNLQTSAPDAAVLGNSQRSATSELGRSARATAVRTAAPRP